MQRPPVRIGIVLGTRPDAVKLAPVIERFQQHPGFETQVVMTGQHRELVEQVLSWFKLSGHYNLDVMQERQSLTDVTCRILQGLGSLFQQLQPRMVLVQGDTTTAFAAAMAAFYQRIPIGHIEAGLRTDNFYDPYPEEANRRLISQIAELHFAPTRQAVENLARGDVMGKIYQTGNTVIDALHTVVTQKPDCPIPGLDWQRYRVLLATVHRRENWGDPLQRIADSFLTIVERLSDVALLLPLHPNPIVREPLRAKLAGHPRIFLCEPLDYPMLVGAMQRSTLILTDSGGLQEEAPTLNKPLLVLRETTERPEAIQAGTALLVGTHSERIVNTTIRLLKDQAAYNAMAGRSNPFGDGQAAQRILEILQSYFQLEKVDQGKVA